MNSNQNTVSDENLTPENGQATEGQIAYEGFPYRSNFVELSNDLNMHFLDEGQGDPIILLHGLPTSSFLWRNIIPELAENNRVIVPDLINFGLSDKTEPLDFVEHGQLLTEFIDSLGLDDITFVLHDIGGPVGMTHIADNPEDVKALVLTETFVVPFESLAAQAGRSSPAFAQFVDPVNRRTNVIENNVIVEGLLLDPAFGSIAEMPTEAEKEVYRAPFLEPQSREQFLLQVLEVPFLDTTGHPIFDPDGPGGVPAEPVPNIEEYDDFATFFETNPDIPKLLITSTPGNIIPPDAIPAWQEAIPGLEVREIGSEENPGFHFLQEDLPEEFTAALAGWIEEINFEAVQPTFGGLESDVFELFDTSNQDLIFAGAGDDLVDASQATTGGNRLLGGTGLDELFAGYRDRVSGGTGDDILDASAGLGNNRLYGGEGNDELFAGESDRLFAGSGDDLLDATNSSSHNYLYGQDGNDTFFLGSGDRLLGGDGDDAFFVTNGGDNLITGGAGADAFWIATGELITTTNTITDFELDEDVIGVAGIGATSIDDLELNQVGNDAVISFSGFELATLLNTQASDLAADGTFVFA